jgi:DNA-binding NarL/FixJ family response regulator
MPTRLVLVDDHPLILDALENLFRDEEDMVVVARCTSAEEAGPAIRAHKPDVVVLDVRMPNRDGLSVLRAIRAERHSARVVLFTGAVNDDVVLEALRLGARGLVLKEMAPRLLLQCVRAVAAGEEWLERGSTTRALASMLRRERGSHFATRTGLTPRELEIIRWVAQGLRNREIAEKLNVSEGTVKVHLHNIYAKLDVDSRIALIDYARNHELV